MSFNEPQPLVFDVHSILAEKLRSKLSHSTVLTPDDGEDYDQSIIRWSDTFERRAAIVVYVGSSQDVSMVVSFCRENSLRFVVSGGKHSVGGYGSITGDVVIDLAKMRGVHINSTSNAIDVQGGCTWKDVDEAAGAYGLAAVGGTVNHTGLGALCLGGGYGWLTGRYGLTIDNLISIEMVLADGTIVEANDKNHTDLFWAVRGAGQCFGVATRFTFQAHEQNTPIWAGQLVFEANEHLDAIVKFANFVVAQDNPDAAMLLGISAPSFVKGPAAIVTAFFNGPKSKGEAFFAPLLALCPIKNTTDERPYSEMNGVMNHARWLWRSKNCERGILQLIDELGFLHQQLPETKRTIILFEFYHNAQVSKVPHGATAFANRGMHQNAMLGPFWVDPANDSACRRWADHMSMQFKLELERVGIEKGNLKDMQAVGEYSNYDGTGTAPRDIFKGNYQRLKEIKGILDPENMFNGSYDLT